MLSFNQYLSEARKNDHHFDVVVKINHSHPPHVIVVSHHGGALHEKQYIEKEQDHLGGHLYKVLGHFQPSKLDHDTITKEFHEHLHKHGYYAFTPSHPLVMSPKEQHFKAAFKDKAFKGKGAKFEKPHHDLGFGGKGTGRAGRFTALWSTKGSTHIFHHENSPTPNARYHEAEKAGHVAIINDKAVRHAASGEKDRWFIRQGEVKKIPKSGLVLRTKDGVKHFGHDLHSFMAAKTKSVGGPRREVREWHNRQLKIQQRTGKVDPHHAHVMDWVKKNYPEYHPEHHSGEDRNWG